MLVSQPLKPERHLQIFTALFLFLPFFRLNHFYLHNKAGGPPCFYGSPEGTNPAGNTGREDRRDPRSGALFEGNLQ